MAGPRHYRLLFSDPGFRDVLVATGLYTLATVAPSVLLALLIALLPQNPLRGLRLFRTAFALPAAYSVATATQYAQSSATKPSTGGPAW